MKKEKKQQKEKIMKKKNREQSNSPSKMAKSNKNENESVSVSIKSKSRKHDKHNKESKSGSKHIGNETDNDAASTVTSGTTTTIGTASTSNVTNASVMKHGKIESTRHDSSGSEVASVSAQSDMVSVNSGMSGHSGNSLNTMTTSHSGHSGNSHTTMGTIGTNMSNATNQTNQSSMANAIVMNNLSLLYPIGAGPGMLPMFFQQQGQTQIQAPTTQQPMQQALTQALPTAIAAPIAAPITAPIGAPIAGPIGTSMTGRMAQMIGNGMQGEMMAGVTGYEKDCHVGIYDEKENRFRDGCIARDGVRQSQRGQETEVSVEYDSDDTDDQGMKKPRWIPASKIRKHAIVNRSDKFKVGQHVHVLDADGGVLGEAVINRIVKGESGFVYLVYQPDNPNYTSFFKASLVKPLPNS